MLEVFCLQQNEVACDISRGEGCNVEVMADANFGLTVI